MYIFFLLFRDVHGSHCTERSGDCSSGPPRPVRQRPELCAKRRGHSSWWVGCKVRAEPSHTPAIGTSREMWQVWSLLCFEFADIASGTPHLEAVAPGYLRRKTTKCPQVGNPVGGCCLGLLAGFGAPLVGPAPE